VKPLLSMPTNPRTDPKDFLNEFHLCKETVISHNSAISSHLLQPTMEALPIKRHFYPGKSSKEGNEIHFE